MIGLIVARAGSKGLPGKNRILFDYTADAAIQSELNSIWVSTDDPEIMSKAERKGVKVHERPSSLGADDASVMSVVSEFAGTHEEDEPIFVLYPTYPRRGASVIDETKFIFENYLFPVCSMIGFKKAKTSPYMCYEMRGQYIEPVLDHDYYRRQDYPPAFEICHAVCIVDPSCLHLLDSQMVGEKTIPYFFSSESMLIDIDTEEDLKEFDNGRE